MGNGCNDLSSIIQYRCTHHCTRNNSIPRKLPINIVFATFALDQETVSCMSSQDTVLPFKQCVFFVFFVRRCIYRLGNCPLCTFVQCVQFPLAGKLPGLNINHQDICFCFLSMLKTQASARQHKRTARVISNQRRTYICSLRRS